MMQDDKTLDNSQQQAVDEILQSIKNKHQISILTGGPGRGKTFTIKELYKQILDTIPSVEKEKIFFAAPTGKAAKVMADSTADLDLYNAPSTIHRMLGCMGGNGWTYNSDNQLDADIVVLDESSMIDSLLTARVISSVSDDAHFVLVGDRDQLPPVAAGCPFRDLISGELGIVHGLNVNHRQQQGSMIADACDKVKAGEIPVFGETGKHTLGKEREDDFFHIEMQADEKEGIPAKIFELVESWYNDKKDFVVLAPQRTGACGVEAINLFLQEALNPPSPEKSSIVVFDRTIRQGDRVLQTKNDYTLGNSGIFNGYLGTVVACGDDSMTVDFDGEVVYYESRKQINNLRLGYCITVHKSQGSEWKYGVLVCHSSHHFMWNRQLLYTAISRFKEKLFVVGNHKALKHAVRNSVENKRNTYLGLEL